MQSAGETALDSRKLVEAIVEPIVLVIVEFETLEHLKVESVRPNVPSDDPLQGAGHADPHPTAPVDPTRAEVTVPGRVSLLD